MKRFKRYSVVSALSLAFVLGFATSAYTQEHHPAIREAQRFLEQTMDTLSHAQHDFGGHRVKAMDHNSPGTGRTTRSPELR